jgi:EthD domain
MVDIVFLLRRKPEMHVEEFHRYWREDHGPLVASQADALGIKRYVQLHTVDTPLNEVVRASRGCEPMHFDGVALVSFESLDALADSVSTPGGAAGSEALITDERRFLDLERCVVWFADHHAVIGD